MNEWKWLKNHGSSPLFTVQTEVDMEPLPRALPQNMNRICTPRKEPPPSLSFGSSSSPAFESPPTVGKELRFMHWSPTQGRTKKGQALQLLPSQFPPPQFGTLPSSPPEPRSRQESIDNGSPRPRRAKRSSNLELEPSASLPVSGHKRKAEEELALRSAKVHTKNHASPTSRPAALPLLSSKAFAKACATRSSRSYAEPQSNPQVGTVSHDSRLEPELELIQEQFPSRGLGLSFIIDLNGKANVNPLILTPSTPQTRSTNQSNDTVNSTLMTPHTRQTVDAILDEESDLESDGEFEENTDRLTATPELATRTPPRFASLGNSDAASAFARTLARSREVGKGSMFLFQSAGSPRKHPEFTPYTPFTPFTSSFVPETPRRAAGSDSSAFFEFGMQTPPNPLYGFDTSGGYYATGMTPYLSAQRSHEIANI